MDTSGLLAALNASEPYHEAARRALEADPGPLFLSPFVLCEADYLLATNVGVMAELSLLGEVAAGAFRLEPFDLGDVEEAAKLVERYRDLNIGLTDASLVVIAARHDTDRILTIDERHFRVLRTHRGAPFKLLPLDV